jgi:hypothetical protein
MVAAVALVVAKMVRSSQRPDIEGKSLPRQEIPAPVSPPRHRTERLRRTQPLPEPNAPTEEWREAIAPLTMISIVETIHDVPTGPLILSAPPPAAGAVETAMPDDPTKGHAVPAPIEEGVPHPTERGTTIKIIEGEVAPKTVWQGTGTEPIIIRRKTERIPEDVVAAAAGLKVSEPSIVTPDWAADLERRRAEYAAYLLQFQGPRGRGLIKADVLESAIRFLERDFSSSAAGCGESFLVLSYLRLSQMGISSPFDLDREIGVLMRKPEPGILDLELNELRELLKAEPLETNRVAVRYVLDKSKQDIRWLLEPANRVLHLLCRKRADIAFRKGSSERFAKYPLDILSYWKRLADLH